MGLLPIIRRIRRPLTLEERPEAAKPVDLAQATPEQAPVVIPDLPPAPEVPTEKPRRKRKHEAKTNEAERPETADGSGLMVDGRETPGVGTRPTGET